MPEEKGEYSVRGNGPVQCQSKRVNVVTVDGNGQYSDSGKGSIQ